jgi:hypothetical protein
MENSYQEEPERKVEQESRNYKFKDWNVIPGELINLVVAPKVNDHHNQKVHNKIMSLSRRRNLKS